MNKQFLIVIIALFKVFSLNAQDFQNNFDTGKMYYQKHKYDSAILYFTKAIEVNSNIIDLYVSRARTYETIGNLSGALNDYNKIIAIDSMYGKAYQGRANIYMKTMQRDKEIQDYKKAIELLPDDENTYYSYINMGLRIIENNGNNDTSLYYVNKAIELTQRYKYFSSLSCYYTRGKIFSQKGEYQNAVTDFTFAIDSGYKLPDCYLKRAETYKKLGQNDKAKIDFKKYKELKSEESKKTKLK